MFELKIDDILVKANEDIGEDVARAYIAHVHKTNPSRQIQDLTLNFNGEDVDMEYTLSPVQFEKIRRITGYLVGDMTRWNDAKSAEEGDRVKHG